MRSQDAFENRIADWGNAHRIPIEIFDGKESLMETVDSLVILHEDHNILKEHKELRELVEKNHKPTRQVDINGTINASVSSFLFWLENNKPKSVLIVGDEKLVSGTRLETYLTKLSAKLN